MYEAQLILVGAGPGDPDLLTVKAWRALCEADLILFDHLANPALLDLASPGCQKIFVGKRPYAPAISQQEIHELIRQYAVSPIKIVRLKGGDPYIFGRGFEEFLFGKELGISVTYIPGITSMQTGGLANIPLTHRAVSDGVWVITGTRQDGALSKDLRLALRSKATVVIYMGMRQLPEISRLYQLEGYGKMPAAIIQDGSLPRQRTIVGTAGRLAELAKEHQFSHPAVIIIGEVVSLYQNAETDQAGPRSHPELSEGSAETGPVTAIDQAGAQFPFPEASRLPFVI
ncbi:MAG TPA: uroporphyrinogen-III C-methyltransferase [Puia sp.]|nr:uroporphyrinogen-III C-methyltransferase [Puia sp.]